MKVIIEIQQQMDSIKLRFEKPDAAIIALRDEAKAILRANDCLPRVTPPPSDVGVHPDNRYGDGLEPSDVIGLIADIYGQGFSVKALQDPTYCQVHPHGHPSRKRILDFNVALV